MKCVIPGGHIKVFGKAIYSLSRISDELWFDPTEDGLSLKAVNSSRSAYACVFFSSMFFHSYHKGAIHEQGHGDVMLQLKCKFQIKSVLPVFRSVNILGRNVDKCIIYTNFNDCCVVFQLFCKHGLTKTYNLAYEDCEPLQALFAKHLCPIILKIQSRVLSDVIIHFPTSQEEITFSITPLKVSLKTYSDEGFAFSKAMHTEIHLSPDEFDYFQVGVDSEVTFCLKELRGFLALAEAINTHISVHVGHPGKPIAFSIDDKILEANCILATLAESESGVFSQRSQDIISSSLCTATLDQNKENAGSGSRIEDNQIMENKLQNSSTYNKFCHLFFGAISSEQQKNCDQRFYSLATASEDEEDFCRDLSQTF